MFTSRKAFAENRLEVSLMGAIILPTINNKDNFLKTITQYRKMIFQEHFILLIKILVLQSLQEIMSLHLEKG